MLHFEVSWLPLVVVALVNFVLSWLYYSPVVPWFKTWQISTGMDPNKKEMTEEDKKAMPRLMGGALVATFLFAYGLQVVVHSVGAADFGSGALAGLVVWAAFAVTHSLNTQFEGRKPVVLVINNVLYLLTYAGFGGLVAVWK
jgi:UDP-N-acetylmuramyl pentapeptide phosphotransferase/UDP-N-acetylglucosamine-1-phosphate transferase